MRRTEHCKGLAHVGLTNKATLLWLQPSRHETEARATSSSGWTGSFLAFLLLRQTLVAVGSVSCFWLINRSIKPLRVLLFKRRLLTVFGTAETVLLPDFKTNTRQRVSDSQLDLKPVRDDGKTAAQLLLLGSTMRQSGD